MATPYFSQMLLARQVDTMDFTAAPFFGSVPCFALVERM